MYEKFDSSSVFLMSIEQANYESGVNSYSYNANQPIHLTINSN